MQNNSKISKLKESVIYKMSLGSKELYHSNVWAWLIECDKNYIKAFDESYEPASSDKIIVEREKNNIDILITIDRENKGKKYIIIENKLKSTPSKGQLEKYDSLFEKYEKIGILTGLKPSIIVNSDNTIALEKSKSIWIFKSYNDISTAMQDITMKSELNDKDKIIINEYLDNNKIMEGIVDEHLRERELIQTWDQKLDEVGLADLINKTSGSLFLTYINKRLEEENLKHEDLYITQTFHNKKITLDIRYTNYEKRYESSYLKIGVQIEGTQYRRMVTREKSYLKTGTNYFDSVFNEFCEKGFFDSNYIKGKPIRWNGHNCAFETSMKGNYCKYDNGGEVSIYQYFNIKEKESYEELYKWIVEDLKLVKTLYDDNLKILK